VGRLVVHLRKTHKEAVGLDEFLALGLLALCYGLAVFCHAYGFLAAFAAGVALRRVEAAAASDAGASGDGGDAGHSESEAPPPPPPPPDVADVASAGSGEEVATDPERAPAYMAQAVLGFNEQLERVCEVGVVLLLGGMLTTSYLSLDALWFVPLLLLVIRPAAVWVALIGSRSTRMQRALMCWFGIRGVGSLYYLAYALTHGVGGTPAHELTALTLTTVAASVALHGVSVTPLMNAYGRLSGRRPQQA
jgi:NhaP-type Na+/H+ or K+/H+ antiporter